MPSAPGPSPSVSTPAASRRALPKAFFNAWAERHLAGLRGGSASRYVANSDAEIGQLLAGDILLPLVLSDGRRGEAGICSIRSHYVDYTQTELGRLKNAALRGAAGCLLSGLGRVIDSLHLGRVAFANHWLLSTNPVPPLDTAGVKSLISQLCQNHPGRTMVIRSLDRRSAPGLISILKREGFHLVRSRRVWYLDPERGGFSRSRDVRRDIALLRKSPFQIQRLATPVALSDLERITELYHRLYLVKYCGLNPAYTIDFFRHVIEQQVLEVGVLRRHQYIDGFAAWYDNGVSLTGIMSAYDMDLPREWGLFRQTTALKLQLALESGKPVNLSAGAGHFKECRGGEAVVEYDAVYCAHCPATVRLAWRHLAILLHLGEKLGSSLYR